MLTQLTQPSTRKSQALAHDSCAPAAQWPEDDSEIHRKFHRSWALPWCKDHPVITPTTPPVISPGNHRFSILSSIHVCQRSWKNNLQMVKDKGDYERRTDHRWTRFDSGSSGSRSQAMYGLQVLNSSSLPASPGQKDSRLLKQFKMEMTMYGVCSKLSRWSCMYSC